MPQVVALARTSIPKERALRDAAMAARWIPLARGAEVKSRRPTRCADGRGAESLADQRC